MTLKPSQLKTHEIAGQMFDNEYDLAVAVIDGMTARSHQGGYTLERFKFLPSYLATCNSRIKRTQTQQNLAH